MVRAQAEWGLVSTVSLPDTKRGQGVGAIGKHFAVCSDGTRLSVIVSLYESGGLIIDMNSVYPLARASEAMARGMARHVRGKIVI
ncbi:zinc-binding dehydrogenase [Mycetohabitans sp. B8]|uniref:zinc-binding dehydrogenase n=1 Tax=Mycetohabitans sp. B8 TaxID=2841845 RepID=UPI001F47F9DB|nr:zinc-binding dehydrogenase [Mycetohabitans sp. B8]MCG1042346.1 zinc-binding dehydrogenase [Mycetohabitans sp. B8]